MLGEVARLRASFTQGGDAVDPTTATITVRKPDKTVEAYTGSQLKKESTGVYRVDVVLDQAGTWRWRVDGTGRAQGAGEATIYVQSRSV
jgi:hypothetical protein